MTLERGSTRVDPSVTPRARVGARAPWLALALGLAGCGQLLQVDEYGVDPSGGPLRDVCAAAERPLAGGGCAPTGVSSCGTGFDADGLGGCVARLPSGPCASGTYAYPGKVSCARPSEVPCPTAADPASFAAVYAGAQHFVWGGYAGAQGDGTPARPWTTIADALAHAADGDLIVVSAGEYAENVRITRPVQLVGVCPERTIVSGVAANQAAIVVEAGGSGSRLRALGISGAGAGLQLLGADDVEVRGLIVQDTAGPGIELVMVDPTARPAVLVEETLVDRALGVGILAGGFALTVQRSSVRATREDAARLAFGVGISVQPGRFVADRADPTNVVRGQLLLREALLEGNHDAGVRVEGSEATIEDTLVRDTRASLGRAGLGLPPMGLGIDVSWEVARGLDIPPERPVVVRRSVVEHALGAGIRAWKANVRLEDTVVRDVEAAPGGGCAGHGLRVLTDRTVSATATVVTSLLERTQEAGVHVLGGGVVLDGALIRDVRGDGCAGRYGDALALYSQPLAYAQGSGEAAASVSRSKLDGSRRAAISSFGGGVKLEDSVLEGAPVALLGAPSPQAEDEPRRESTWLDPGSSLCGSRAALGRCGVALDEAADPALFARDASGELAPTVARFGKPRVGSERLDEYVFWVLGRDEIPVSVTDVTGEFRQPFVPAASQVVLAASRAGLAPNFFSGRTTALDSEFDTGFGSLRGLTETGAAALGTEIDFSKGRFIANAWDATGLVIGVEPAAGVTIVYLGEDGLPVPPGEPQETTAAGFAYGYGAAPGLLEIRMTSTNPRLECSPDTLAFQHGLPTGPGSVRVPSFPGVWSVTAMRCAVPSAP